MEAVARVDVYRAVSDPTRRAILDLLAEGDLAVRDMQTSFRMSQPALSQHLRVLRDAGLVTERRSGRLRIYRLSAGPLADMGEWLDRYAMFWDERFARLGAYLDGRGRQAPDA